jgi:Putative Actinobacterial Holin-X, holin superfamily III
MREGAARREPRVSRILNELWHDAQRWLGAETRLVRATAGLVLSDVIWGVVFLGCGLACIIVSLIVLSQAAILGLAPLVGSAFLSALIVTAVFIVMGAIFAGLTASYLRSAWREATLQGDAQDG